MKIYKFRKFKLWNFILNMLLQPFMWVTGSKDSHWWDWEPDEAIKSNASKVLILNEGFAKRQYTLSKLMGRYNLDNLRNLYLTLFGIKIVYIIEPISHKGMWSLAVKKVHYKDLAPFFMICNLKHKGQIKYLVDGDIEFVGLDEQDRVLKLKKVGTASRYKYRNLTFL